MDIFEKFLGNLGYSGESIHKRFDCIANYMQKSFDVYVSQMIVGNAPVFMYVKGLYSIMEDHVTVRR